ncbi:MAG: PucR family transcriptional regulator ligand-binding domain-containing protein [Tissierellia bacterium]|nr:PucR family transcriptional regulator ligand-binding domain-containing protein [Tissierellia bacterium]
MKVEDLFKINNDLEYISGRSGYNNVIKYIDIVEIPEGVHWTSKNDFIITTGYFIHDNKDYFLKLVKTLIEKEVSGLGIKLGKYVNEIPQKVLQVSENNKFPIINIPIYLKYRDIVEPVLHKISNDDGNNIMDIKSIEDFFLYIISTPHSDSLEIKSKAKYLGIDYNANRCVCILECPISPPKYRLSLIINMVKERFNFKNLFYINQLSQRKIIFICELQYDNNDIEKNKIIFNQLLNDLISILKDTSLKLGVSNNFNDLNILKLAYRQADIALKLGTMLNSNNSLYFYDDYMMSHLIYENLDSPIIINIYNNSILKLKQYDKDNESDLYFTLINLVKNDFNINKSSKEIFVHRNTLYNRIDKINKILGCNINDTNKKLLISILIKYDKLIN